MYSVKNMIVIEMIGNNSVVDGWGFAEAGKNKTVEAVHRSDCQMFGFSASYRLPNSHFNSQSPRGEIWGSREPPRLSNTFILANSIRKTNLDLKFIQRACTLLVHFNWSSAIELMPEFQWYLHCIHINIPNQIMLCQKLVQQWHSYYVILSSC